MSSPVVSMPRDQTNPDVARLPDGGYVLAWEAPGFVSSVFLKRLDANGTPVGSEVLVTADAKGAKAVPSIAVAANGNILVTWNVSDPDSLQQSGVFGRMFSSSGSSLQEMTAGFPISSGQLAKLANATTTANGNEFAVVWEYGDGTTHNVQMSTVRYGSPPVVGTSVAVSADASVYRPYEGFPTAASGGGMTAVAWVTTGKPASDIAVRVFDASGNGSPTTILNHANSENGPAVAYIGNGKFAVVWLAYTDDAHKLDLYGTIIDSQGRRDGPVFEVASTLGVSELVPDIQPDGSGFIVAWASVPKESGQNQDIFARRFDADGNAKGDIVAIAAAKGDFVQNPAVATAASGDAVIVWEQAEPNKDWDILLSSYKSGLTSNDLFRVTSDGVTMLHLGSTPDAGTPAAARQFTGDSHSQVVSGTAGIDVIDGGGGVDALRVGVSLSAVQVSRSGDYLALTTTTQAGATTDYVRNVEAVVGTNGVLMLTGPEDFETAYLARNPDVAAAVRDGILGSGLEHWLAHGRNEGRLGPSIFDEAFYLADNADVAAAVRAGAFASGQAHWMQYGKAEGRSPSPLFDADYYLAKNQDVAAAVAAHRLTALDHFLAHGMAEGRAGSPIFSPQAYLSANPGVSSSGLDAYQHFSVFGWEEGRAITAYDHQFLA